MIVVDDQKRLAVGGHDMGQRNDGFARQLGGRTKKHTNGRTLPNLAFDHDPPAELADDTVHRRQTQARANTLGHSQRGGTPTAYDRVLATRYGMAAVDSVVHNRWGRMVSLSGTSITHVAFEDALGRLNTVPQSRYDEAAVLFG